MDKKEHILLNKCQVLQDDLKFYSNFYGEQYIQVLNLLKNIDISKFKEPRIIEKPFTIIYDNLEYLDPDLHLDLDLNLLNGVKNITMELEGDRLRCLVHFKEKKHDIVRQPMLITHRKPLADLSLKRNHIMLFNMIRDNIELFLKEFLIYVKNIYTMVEETGELKLIRIPVNDYVYKWLCQEFRKGYSIDPAILEKHLKGKTSKKKEFDVFLTESPEVVKLIVQIGLLFADKEIRKLSTEKYKQGFFLIVELDKNIGISINSISNAGEETKFVYLPIHVQPNNPIYKLPTVYPITEGKINGRLKEKYPNINLDQNFFLNREL